MTPEQEKKIIADLERDIEGDVGPAAQRHLDEGRAIYYRDLDTPKLMVIKEYPSGKKELVSFETGVEVFVRVIAE